ncbi:MAG: hypothetical protein K1X75_07745 [Leptospirales bacterium]|nr:hypothetical protein [Leptospirales bacterium]
MTEATLLLRQVNPAWIQGGRITSQVFKPTPKDQKRLSVYDGDRISAEDSWKHYTQSVGYSAVGVVAVSVGECGRQELPAEADPEAFPEHVTINFGDFSNAQIEKKAKYLKQAALRRGWLHEADFAP